MCVLYFNLIHLHEARPLSLGGTKHIKCHLSAFLAVTENTCANSGKASIEGRAKVIQMTSRTF